MTSYRVGLLSVALACVYITTAWAEPNNISEQVDQSLFPSEPLEETEEIEEKTAPAPTAAKKNPTPEKAEPAPEYNTALLQGLKKVTAESSSIEAPIDTPVAFGTLSITVKKCLKSKPEERPESTALILIQDHRVNETPVTVFSGWMIASSPSISALEHPVYDMTLLDCIVRKTPAVAIDGPRPPPR